jgi:hypothetical protein
VVCLSRIYAPSKHSAAAAQQCIEFRGRHSSNNRSAGGSAKAAIASAGGMALMRFTIRDLLWLMVVVGLAIGWWVDRSRLIEKVAKLKSDLNFSRAVDGIGGNLDH